MTFIVSMFVIGVVIAAVIGDSRSRKQQQRTFSALGKQLGGGHDVAARHAWGEVANAKVSYRFTTRGSGKNTTLWTEITAEIPAQYPLRLFIRKHGWLDHGQIERGEMVDVIVGDRAFDDRFLVEAAPADVARLLIDPRERSYLLELADKHWLEITTVHDGVEASFKLAIRPWIYDLPDATRAIEAIAAIAGRLREAYAAVESAAETKDVGSPYRPMLDDGAAKQAADARLEEVQRVDDIRTKRTAREQTTTVVVVAIFVLLAIFVIAASH